ncbi:efflux RND transporter periplasmic adaptor subunit [Shewanella vesiculosa]|uniref:efflux RND transporter periplasmic adaptor subunit n=1 Tax=Shewanella vesiculosa TaxID=518738 RepID=UPI000F50D3BE|nr:efflux RND transporter periplasmic adaptor subunit [Shewanella vesiculosa]RPA46069.1 efflux RND transporter periplasmic adaptor subunit [Shewanella vesiculosa]UJL41744.1 efflux RND transporter periplasmic adaptor subunit [Shewanella vesiculosa]
MKKLPLSSVLLGAFVGVIIPITMTSPVVYGAEHDHAQHQVQAGKTYTCPMHPEVISDKEGTCPICNMFLVVKEEEEEESTVDDTQAPMANMQSAASVEKNQADKVFSQPEPALVAKLVPTANQSDSTNVKYVCPMHPHVISDAPGTCPICGMNLEKVTVTDPSQEIVVGVSGGMQQALGMRSHVVERTSLSRQVNTIGTVEYNQNAIGHVHTRATGWIETLTVNNVGQQIKKGQLLYELYSPELVTAQDDYSQAQDYLKQDTKRGSSLLRKARKRLELLGVDSSVIKHLEKTGETIFKVPFYAPQDGFISKLTVRDGMYIQPGDTLFEIVNLDSVWVIADVFENEQNWLQQGRKVTVSAAAQGLFDIDSTIDYIYPELDPVTRAMRVRIKLNNHHDKLRPGSLVDVTLYGLPKNNVLTVPTEALILTGRENRIVVQRSDTSFASVPVKIGMMADGRAEILEGLNEHDKVVISGQFLLDSEASIQGSLQRLSNAPINATATDAHQH